MGLGDEGVLQLEKWLSDTALGLINNEIDEAIESGPNSALGAIRTARHVRSLRTPLLTIRSRNLLEVALEILSVIGGEGLDIQNLILTDVSIHIETNNRQRLFWHTDHRKGMLRAQIYLRGGRTDSGAFEYILGSHRHDLTNHPHKLTDREIADFKGRMKRMDGGEGSLVVFDSYGFHAKSACTEERRTIMFEFQPSDSEFPKSPLVFDNGILSDKVIANISAFRVGTPSTYGSEHGSYPLLLSPVWSFRKAVVRRLRA